MEQTGQPVPDSTAKLTEGAGPLGAPLPKPLVYVYLAYIRNTYITEDAIYRRSGTAAVQLTSWNTYKTQQLSVYSASKFIVGKAYNLVVSPSRDNEARLIFYGPLLNGGTHHFIPEHGTLTVKNGPTPGWIIIDFTSSTLSWPGAPSAVIDGSIHVKDVS
ncbi:hypothetical protein [Pseudomonas edaphica]|uniref:hypothetical protein n=1 Tax=Pseudomonas edaphica TaxID=2006980 RepID=UPI003D13B65D